MALTNDEKKFIAERIRWGRRHDMTDEAITSDLIGFGFKKETVKKYLKAITK